MKRSLVLLLLPLLLVCCKKKNNSSPDTTSTSDLPFSYAVTYDPVLRSGANMTVYFSFNVKVLTGDIVKNPLECSLEPPLLVKATPSSMVVTQLLGGVFKVDVGLLAIGDYPFKLKIKTEENGERVYNLTLRVTPEPDFAPLLAGNYDSCYDFCAASGIVKYASQVNTVADTPYLLTISNIKNLGADFIVRAKVSNNVTIPMQEVGGKTIWGSGTYSKDGRPLHENDFRMTINDTIVTGVDTLTCIVHIEH